MNGNPETTESATEKAVAVWCGYCRTSVAADALAIMAHLRACEVRDPWSAFFRAPDKAECRRILQTYCGLKTPPPMTEEVKAKLRERNADPAARAVRAAKRRADNRIRASFRGAARKLVRKRG